MTLWIFGFDRDCTIDSSPDPGPIPLKVVRWLASQPYCEVWAIGNQALKAEAGIPGIEEMAVRLGYHPRDVLTALGEQVDFAKGTSKVDRNVFSKRKRLLALTKLFPQATRRICTDDFDISLEGWEYLAPHDFVSKWPELRSGLPRSV